MGRRAGAGVGSAYRLLATGHRFVRRSARASKATAHRPCLGYPGPLGIAKFGNDTRPNSSRYYFWAGSAPKFGYSGVTASNIQEICTNDVCNVSVDLSYVPWSPGK